MSSGIIVGYDGSPCSKAALRAGLEVGKAYGENVTIAFGYELSPVGGEVKDYADALKELAHQRIAEASELAAAQDGEVDAVVIEQAPASGLVALADERDARMIVVGTHGESPLRGALIGSTPHKLLQLSDRPVLVIPAGRG